MKSGLTVQVPDVFWLMAGFSCKSRTPLSSSSRKNLNCIVRGDTTTETAMTFYSILNFIRRRRPQMLTLENVKQLMAKPDAETQSDCEHITTLLQELNYHVQPCVFDCVHYGSPAVRLRIYFQAWLVEPPVGHVLKKEHTLAQGQYWAEFLNYITIPSLDINRFFERDFQNLEDLVTGKIDVQASTRDGSGKDSSSEKWKTEHVEAFQELGVRWPPELTLKPFEFAWVEMEPCGFFFMRGFMSERATELAYYLMVRFPFEIDEPEFCDVNPSLSRICADKANASPWRTTLATFTGGAIPVIRYRHGGQVVCRTLFGIEAFRAIGWDQQHWREGCYSDQMLRNMAGNAFSGFALAPMLLVAFGFFGEMPSLFEEEAAPAVTELCSSTDVDTDCDSSYI